MTATEYKAGSNLEKILSEGTFAVTGECGPPKGADVSVIEEKAKILKGYVDAVNITDNQTAVVRVCSMASGYTAQQNGLEAIMQMTCRDRNRLAMQADILGASTLGIKNILCLTGDHMSFGNHPEAKGVHDLDAINLIKMYKDMRDKKKIEAGADFIQTQCIFNVPKFKKWMEEVRALGLHKEIKILAGITPLKGVGGARYMQKFVPGIDVPQEIVDRMAACEKGAPSQAEGKKIAVEMIKEFAEIEGVAGVHIMAIEWEVAVPEIVEAAGLMPRPAVA